MGALVADCACHPMRLIVEMFGRGFYALNHGLGNRKSIETPAKHPGDGGFAYVAVAGDILHSDPFTGALPLLSCFFHVFPVCHKLVTP